MTLSDIKRRRFEHVMAKKFVAAGVAAALFIPLLPVRANPEQTRHTVLLSPQSIVEFARNNNPGIQSLLYSVAAAEYTRKGALAGFLPKLQGRISYTKFSRSPYAMTGMTSVSGSHGLPGLTPQADSALGATALSELVSAGSINPLTGEPYTVDDLRLIIDAEVMKIFSSMPEAPTEMYDFGITLSQPIFTGGKIINAYRAACYSRHGAQAVYERARQMIELGALRLFWSLVAAREGVGTVRDNLAWLERLFKDQNALFDEGMIVEDDLLRLKTQVSLTKLALRRMNNSIFALEDQIRQLCNLPFGCELIVDPASLSELDRDVRIPAPDIGRILEIHDDIIAAEFQIRALTYLKRVELAAYLPNIFGAYNYDFKNSDPAKTDQLAGEWSLGLVLDWNLFDWGAGFRKVQQANIRIARMKLNLQSKKDSIRVQITGVCRRITEAMEMQELAFETVQNARRSLKSAELRYHEGIITSTELLSAGKELTQAEQELIQARIEKVLALEEYRIAVGEGNGEME